MNYEKILEDYNRLKNKKPLTEPDKQLLESIVICLGEIEVKGYNDNLKGEYEKHN